MTEEEREQERKEIMQRFGDGIADLLKRVKEKRNAENSVSLEGVYALRMCEAILTTSHRTPNS